MPSIVLTPAGIATARLTVAPAGFEWFEFEAELAPATRLRFAPDGRGFPAKGLVSIRRGPDRAASGERIEDAFRYIESCRADDTGELVEERFGVTLFLAEDAFDRLIARAHWGLPEVALFFDAENGVVSVDPEDAEALWFRPAPQPWATIASATLTQRLATRPRP